MNYVTIKESLDLNLLIIEIMLTALFHIKFIKTTMKLCCVLILFIINLIILRTLTCLYVNSIFGILNGYCLCASLYMIILTFEKLFIYTNQQHHENWQLLYIF